MKQKIIRAKYSVTCDGYDELYIGEQFEKYECVFRLKTFYPKGKVLDLGGGTGLLLDFLYFNKLLSKINYYICLDLTPCMLEKCRNRSYKRGLDHIVDLVEADAEYIPLRSNSVDNVYSFTVIDLLQHPEHGIAEAQRVCREYFIVSSLKKASQTHLHRSVTNFGSFLCETSKDIIFVKKCDKNQPVDPSSRLISLSGHHHFIPSTSFNRRR
jgi:ubiquinone/menaquinone biosynthesis C-methylase UbiE